LSAHFAIWRASKDGYLRISSSHGAPEDIVCSEHAVALMNHIISADDVVPSASTDFKESYKVCLFFRLCCFVYAGVSYSVTGAYVEVVLVYCF